MIKEITEEENLILARAFELGELMQINSNSLYCCDAKKIGFRVSEQALKLTNCVRRYGYKNIEAIRKTQNLCRKLENVYVTKPRSEWSVELERIVDVWFLQEVKL